MSSDPFSSLSPSDSGILDGQAPIVPPHVTGSPSRPTERRNSETSSQSQLPPAPAPAPIDASAPEESLRNVPLPEGYLNRMRRFVDEL